MPGDLRLGGIQPGVTRYYIDLIPQTPLVSLEITREAKRRVDRRPSVDSTSGEFIVNLPDAIDLRSCDFTGFAWDGPAIDNVETYEARSLRFTFVGPTEQRIHTLNIPANTCRMTTGEWLAGGAYPVDYQPPRIVSIPLESAKPLPGGSNSVVIYFDEQVNYFASAETNFAIRGKDNQWPIGRVVSDPMVPSVGIRFELPPLLPGEYEVTITNLDVFDFDSNRTWIDGLTFSFRVSDEIADAANSAFDIDRNEVIDPRDFHFFAMDFHDSPAPYFDLNLDGKLDEDDIDEWIARTGIFPMGDVTMDGLFDDNDLGRLAYNTLDTPASRQSGDFDGDGLYTTADLTLAMQHGLDNVRDEPDVGWGHRSVTCRSAGVPPAGIGLAVCDFARLAEKSPQRTQGYAGRGTFETG